MKDPFKLSIAKPCEQNFGDFSKTDRGGFCGACQKEVIDFCGMSNAQIADFFASNQKQNVCGKFNARQLTDFAAPVPTNKRRKLLMGVGMSLMAFFALNTTYGQEKEGATVKEKAAKEKKVEQLLIKGTVTDEAGPLPGVNIYLQGEAVGTTTDFDGNYTFPRALNKGDVLVFSYLGYKPVSIKLTDEHSASDVGLNLSLTYDDIVIMGEVSVKKLFKSKN